MYKITADDVTGLSLTHVFRYAPVIVVASHILTVAYLTYTTGVGLYRSYKNLPPSQDVRGRLDRRKKLVPVFAGLALLGLLTASYSSLTYATLSYRVWADERGIRVPDRYVSWT